MSLFAGLVLGLDNNDMLMRQRIRDASRTRESLAAALRMRLDPKDVPIYVATERHDLGRAPIDLDWSVWRYGTQQFTIAEPHDGWYAGWPAYTTIEDAWNSFYYFELDERTRHPRKYRYRIIAYPPEMQPWAHRMETT